MAPKHTKTLDEFAAELKSAGYRVQRDAHGTITAYERGDRPADTTGALVQVGGAITEIVLHTGDHVAATEKQEGDPPDTIARVGGHPALIVDGKLHVHKGVDEDGEPVLEEVTA